MNPVPSPNQSMIDELIRQSLIQNQNQQVYNRNQDAKNQLIFDQIGIFAKALREVEREIKINKSITVPNPRGEIKAITKRSGIVLARPSVPPLTLSFSSNEVERDPGTITNQVLPKSTTRVPPLKVQPLNKEKLQDKSDIQVHKFLQMFKKHHFNISLAEALALMPKYTKMLKDLLSDKEKLLGLANTSLT
ncbi:hypothetical protein Tco_1355026 [Tanacetum coccineum]